MKKNITWKHSFPIDGGVFYYGVKISMPVAESKVISRELKILLLESGISYCFVSLGGVGVSKGTFEAFIGHIDHFSFGIELRHHDSCAEVDLEDEEALSYIGTVFVGSERDENHERNDCIDLYNYPRERLPSVLAVNSVESLFRYYDSLENCDWCKKCPFSLTELLDEMLFYTFRS